MDIDKLMAVARKHLGTGDMVSSARLCMSDAVELRDAGKLGYAAERALKSIQYSVGVFHPSYKRCKKFADQLYQNRNRGAEATFTA